MVIRLGNAIIPRASGRSRMLFDASAIPGSRRAAYAGSLSNSQKFGLGTFAATRYLR